MKRQPGLPKGPPPDPTVPREEINSFVCDNGPNLTPEQRTWPVLKVDQPSRPQPVPEAPADRPPVN